MKINRFILILARTIDYRIGYTNDDKPDLPVLNIREALFSFFLKIIIVLINFITCAFVIANVIRHW
jgi:hypothetical protein